MSSNENEEVNDQLILNWYSNRKEQENLNSILNNAGNKFSFSQESYTGDVHLYIGLNTTSGELSITEIYADNDTAQNTECLSIDLVQTEKENIGDISPLYPVNGHSIELSVVQGWIGNWIDDATRQEYIEQCFNEGTDNVVMAFKIDKMDFDNGNIHTGYLALEKNSEGQFIPHVIVLNEDAANNTINIEDMTHSAPPFWNYSVFGLLNRLNIK